MGATVGIGPRECCGNGNSEGTSGLRDGKTVWTLDGMQHLPDGVACVHVSSEGITPPLPIPVQEMMSEGHRATEFRRLYGKLVNYGGGPPPGVEQVVLSCSDGFESLGIHVYLTGMLSDDQGGRWIIFVDRQREKSGFVPHSAFHSQRCSKSRMQRLLGSSDSCELVRTPGPEKADFVPCETGCVDLNGSWKSVSVEGDIDRYLADIGEGLVARNIQYRMNYMATAIEQHISIVGKSFTCRMVNPLVDETIESVIGADFEISGPRAIPKKHLWVDGGHSLLTIQGDKIRNKRYLRNGDMVWEFTAIATNASYLRIFKLMPEQQEVVKKTPRSAVKERSR